MSHRTLTLLWLGLLFVAGLFVACRPSPSESSGVATRMGVGSPSSPGPDTFTYASGSAGTYTVPSGYFVRSWWAHNTTGGGTVTIAPTGPREYALCVDAGPDAGDAGPCASPGSAIIIPAAGAYGEAVPVLLGGPDELGPGTVFVFTGTDSYVVGLRPY